MGIAQQYMAGLKQAYYENGGAKHWDLFAQAMGGAGKETLEKLQALYPDLPDSLLQLLKITDGTYWGSCRKRNISLLSLGSDMEEYPYYLLSAQQIIDTKDNFQTWGGYLIAREYDDIPVDAGICDDFDHLCFLHFADCINNGGTSQLFLDFSPSAAGKRGQVLRYLHDPDAFVIVADSFDAYLEMLMDNAYDFITEELIEDLDEEWD